MIYLYNSTETDFRYNGIPLPASFDVVVSHTLNGEYYVIGKHPLDDKLTYKEIVEDRILKVHTMDGMQPFRIVNMNKHETYVEFEAWPLFYADMRNKLVRPLNLKGVSGQAALNAFKNSLLIDTPFDFYSDITDNHDYHTQDENERENNPKQLYNALDVFKTIVKRWGGELWIRGYDIRVNKRIGTDTEAMLYEKKNITEFVDTTNIEGIVTRIHGKSEWQDERQEDEEEGKKHLIETTIDSPLINNYSGVIFEKQYTNNDIRTEQELKNWLNLKFTTENIDKPQRTIEVGTNVIDETKIGFADTLILKYIKHDTDVRIKVVGYEYDGFANELKHVVLGQPKNTSSSTIGNTITDLVNNIVDPVDRKTTIAMNSADGKSTVFHGTADPNTLNLNAKENDTYFRTNGSEKEIWRFTGTLWELILDTSETTLNKEAIEQAQADIAEAKQTADEAVGQIDTAVTNAGFTSLEETISSVQTISNQAQINAGTAIDNALEAMNTASLAVENTGSLNVRVDEVEDTLSIKADKQTVDDLTGVVDSQALDIQANAHGLALKANQDTVDTLAGTVQSLGTEFDVVAGQVNSRVWNTDIETAIDGIEIGGRNLLRNSGEEVSNGAYNIARYFLTDEIKENEEVTLTIWGSLATTKTYFRAFNSGGSISLTPLTDNGDGTYSSTFKWKIGTSTNTYLNVYAFRNAQTGTSTINKIKLEKGNKATDWTPAPEDTLAKIDHIETEWTQTFDTFSQTVSGIDGRVSKQEQTIDRITRTIQEVTEDVEGNTTKINQTVSTVDKHTQTIANIETDLDGKVETSEYNTLVSTVDSTIRRIGDAEGNITQIESNVNGLQTTVANKANQSEVTQLADGLSSVVSQSIKNFQVYARNFSAGPRGFIKDSDGNTLTGGNIENDRNYMLVIIDENDEVVHKKTYDLYSPTIGESEAISFNNAVNYYDDSHLVIVVGSHAAEQSRRLLIKDTIYNLGGSPEVFENMLTTRASYLLVGRKGLGTRNGYETFAQNKRGYLNVVVPVKNGTTSLIGDFNIVSSQISQLSDNINLRVTKGDVLSQINIEAGRTLIQSDRLLLDANTVEFTGSAFIPGAVIANASIDNAKIANATISHGKIASLDASKITTGEIRGINIYMKHGEIGDWILDSGALYSPTGDGLNTTIKATGDVAFATGAPNPRSTTDANLQIWHDGTLRFRRSATLIESDDNYDLRLQAHNWIRLKARATVETDSRIIPDLNKAHNLGEGNLRWNNVYSDAFRTYNSVMQPFQDTDSTEIYSKYDLLLRPDDNLVVHGKSLRPRYTNSTYLGVARNRWMKVYTRDGVSESSDERLKDNIRVVSNDLLQHVNDIRPIMYEDGNGSTSLGYSAQDVQAVFAKYAYKKLGMRESESIKQFNALEKGDSYLGLRYRDIEVLKGAYRDKRINENTGKIVHIEDEVTQLKKRINELEEQLNAS